MAKNPIDSVIALTPDTKKEVEGFAPENNTKLCDLFETDMRVFIQLALGTGMRRSELLGLKWDCLNGDSLKVRRVLVLAGKNVILKDKTKNRS